MFFKKEVYVGNSLDEFKAASQYLSDNDIKYYTKIDYHSHNASIGRGATVGRFFEKPSPTTYYIYVRKKDYDNAKWFLSRYSKSRK